MNASDDGVDSLAWVLNPFKVNGPWVVNGVLNGGFCSVVLNVKWFKIYLSNDEFCWEWETKKQILVVAEEGNQIGKEMAVPSLDGGFNNVPVVPDVGKAFVPQNRFDGEIDRVNVSQSHRGVGEKAWVQVMAKGSRVIEPVKERTWAQVAGPNRFETLREGADETQAHDVVEGIDGPASVFAVRAQQEPRPKPPQKSINDKMPSQTGSTTNGLPGLRLSRQLWPTANRVRRTRFGKIKQLARQIVDNEYQTRVAGQMAPETHNEVSLSGSEFSTSSPCFVGQQNMEASSKNQREVIRILNRHSVNEKMKEVVEIEESENAQCGSARQSGMESGVNFGKLLEQECCHLRTVEEVDEWVSGVIGPLTNKMGLSSTLGDQAVKSFFLKLGYAKVKGKSNIVLNDDEREIANYELCNEELLGDKLVHV
ncbi:hypothetical protein FRX31_025482 [Thalictrum thalictroides]|uniref:Uncharacterized protein n=1 Tax=Thalictrum thalictroides TaxID=46969 RepID=A0A7J6VJJ6_THATH|nr:hypothetical protein FRX31_025482 [Thalictrum thalictroides]